MIEQTGLLTIARAFRHRNYRYYQIGAAVSQIGTWVQRVAVGWLTWELTESGAWLGTIVFAELFPTVVLSPFTGAIADRINRLTLLRVGQSAAGLQALSLAILTLGSWITIEILLALTIIIGAILAFTQAARFALVPSLVPREDLSIAIGIDSITFNMARFLGPAVAGVTVVFAGVGMAFVFNVFSFAIFIALLSRIEAPMHRRTEPGGSGLWREIAAGARFAAGHAGIAPLLVIMIAMGFLGRPLTELFPGFAAAVFDRGIEGLAWLTSLNGIGATVAGFWLAQRGHIEGLTTIAIVNLVVAAVSILAFTATTIFPLALFCGGVLGFSLVVNGVCIQTLIQGAVPSWVRGRVMSLYGILWRGGPAVGALCIGAVSEALGFRLPVAVGGAILVLAALWAWRRRAQMIETLEVEPAEDPSPE